MRPIALAIDGVIAVGVAAVMLIVSPGIALTAVIALLVVVACALSFAVEALVMRRRRK